MKIYLYDDDKILGFFAYHFDFLFVQDFALLGTLNVLFKGADLFEGETMHV